MCILYTHCMYGLFWYLPLSAHVIYWLHISVLEMLASGFSAIIFGLKLGPRVRLTLGADALATPYALTQHSQSSEMLIETHHALLDSPEFAQVSPQIDLGHLRGDANLASDAVSRAEREVLRRLAGNLRVHLSELPFPPSCQLVLDRVLAYAVERNIPVRPNPYQSSPTVIPPSLRHHVMPTAPPPLKRLHAPFVQESGLGKSRRDRIDGDGPGRYAAAVHKACNINASTQAGISKSATSQRQPSRQWTTQERRDAERIH